MLSSAHRSVNAGGEGRLFSRPKHGGLRFLVKGAGRPTANLLPVGGITSDVVSGLAGLV